jgi:HSP20 family protein
MLASRNVFNPLWSPVQQFQNEMNAVLERFGQAGARGIGWAGFPAVNMWENGNSLHVEAELPGLKIDDLEIYVTGNTQLTIKGERKPAAPEKHIRHRQERAFGKFSRTWTLPFAVDPNKVEARFENGVLQIELAKHESAKPRKITVKGE